MAGDEDREPFTREEEADDGAKGEEEDTGAQIAPIIKLEEVAVTTGEENEEALIDLKAKLYRFDGKEWKERGVGQVRLLKHKDSGKIRLLMRQSKTLKICANHLVSPSINLQEHAGNEKSWVWHAQDFADGELKDETFCIRLGTIESAKKFKEAFDSAQEIMASSSAEVPDKDADSTAELLEGLKVVAEEDKVKEKEVKKTSTTEPDTCEKKE